MRFGALVLTITATLALACPAAAEAWQKYANVRFGYTVDIPPGFIGQGEADNGDGQRFEANAAGQSISVYGGHVMDDAFTEAARRAVEDAQSEGWLIAFIQATDRDASFSAVRNGRALYVRMIPLCDGKQSATVLLDYAEADIVQMHSVVYRLSHSLRSMQRSRSC